MECSLPQPPAGLGPWPWAVVNSVCLCVLTLLAVAAFILRDRKNPNKQDPASGAVLPPIRARRSVKHKSWVERSIPAGDVQELLDAAMWAPFHGPRPPWQFVVLGKNAMAEVTSLTMDYYDANWQTMDWSSGGKKTAAASPEEAYQAWRGKMEAKLTRLAPVSYLVAIVMQRQAGSKRMPEWEEMCGTAAAVQNMYIQASAKRGLACYWTSWPTEARDSAEMRGFLGIGPEDRCLGMFVVGACEPGLKDSRQREPGTHMKVEWRD